MPPAVEGTDDRSNVNISATLRALDDVRTLASGDSFSSEYDLLHSAELDSSTTLPVSLESALVRTEERRASDLLFCGSATYNERSLKYDGRSTDARI